MVDGGSWLSVVRVLMSWSPGPGQPGSTQCCSQSLWSSPAGSWATADTQTCLNYQTINCLLNPSFSAFDHASWKYLTSQSLNNCHKFQWASFSAIQSIFKLHVLSTKLLQNATNQWNCISHQSEPAHLQTENWKDMTKHTNLLFLFFSCFFVNVKKILPLFIVQLQERIVWQNRKHQF